MANIKLKNNYWVTESIYDTNDSKTQKQVNADLHQDINDLNGAINSHTTFINTLDVDLSGKKVSIIGDSISTYNATGYKYGNYATYYPTNSIPDVDNVNKTWWKMLLDLSGATLEVNASYSGSCATNSRQESGYPSFYDRCSSTILGNPDVIIVALGTNDSADNVAIGEYDYTTAYTSLSESTFANAYIKGIKALKTIYPNAKIICVSLRMNNNLAAAISYIASNLGCSYVYCGSYVGAVVSHPAYVGMRQITANVLMINTSYTGGYGLMTGSALTKGNYVLSNSNPLEETPSSLRSFNRFTWQDLSANEIARMTTFKNTSGDTYLQIRSHNMPSNAYNTLTLIVDASGNPHVELEQDAWLDALSTAKTLTFGILANTPASVTCTTMFRGILVFTAASSSADRYGMYIVSSSSTGSFYAPIPILSCPNASFTTNGKTLTITSTTACRANFLLFDRGGTVTVSGAA